MSDEPMSNLAAKVLLDQKQRVVNAISMFRPTEHQESFVRKFAEDGGLEFLVGGGNRCLAGCQEIYDPVAKKHRRVDSIRGEFHVHARDPSTGARIVSVAGEPYIKGFEDFYEVFLSNGQSMVVTEQHQWLGADAVWRSAQDWMRPEFDGALLSPTDGEFLSEFPRDGHGTVPLPKPVSSNGIHVVAYKYHSTGEVWDFEVQESGNYECAGILNHNSGKTVVVACCVAAMLLNQPLTLRDGTKLHMRPERWRHEPLLAWIVGFDHRHIGATLFRVLFKGNLFRVIRDQKTGKWRAWDPTSSIDKDVYALTRPSPPLIRASDIVGGADGISWENKKENQISSCVLAHDGTRIEFYASTGARPQGAAVHIIWCDERLDDDRWFPELLMRLPDHRGKLVWTSWPDTSPSSALSELEKRATDQVGDPKAKSFAYRFKGSDNPYTAGEHRDAILATMDEDTRKARDEGTLNMDRWRTYSRYSPYVHRAYGAEPETDDELAKEVRRLNGIGPDWTRYMILDPGTANPAIVMVAVPPPRLGEYIVPYDELYPHYSDADQIAKLLKDKTLSQFFEDFISDAHACRQTPMGFGGTIGQNYARAFREQKLVCRRQGSNFSYGSDDVGSRIMILQSTMTIRPNGRPKLRILGCPKLCKQLEQYKWGADPKGNPTDKPANYQKIDLVQCLEYFASRADCGYVKPPASTPEDMRSPKVVGGSIMKSMGITAGRPKEESIYCGAGTPGYM